MTIWSARSSATSATATHTASWDCFHQSRDRGSLWVRRGLLEPRAPGRGLLAGHGGGVVGCRGRSADGRTAGRQRGVGALPYGLHTAGNLDDDSQRNQGDQGREQAVLRQILPTVLRLQGFHEEPEHRVNPSRLQCKTGGSSMTMISFDMELNHFES